MDDHHSATPYVPDFDAITRSTNAGPGDERYGQEMREAFLKIRDLRAGIHKAALELQHDYVQERDGAAQGFGPVNLRVRSRRDGRSIQIEWMVRKTVFNTKKGWFKNIKKGRSTDYDISALSTECGKAEAWLAPIVTAYELKARPLRASLELLTQSEMVLRMIARRLEVNTAELYPEDQTDDQTDDDQETQ